ncbi:MULTISPECIES: transglycosylase domain-containing protein [unclassified Picosynechococcus]|uniref:transglycosylase domain-containing protein n=2 Tax=Cyanobacteriota TaxID=1117 RepID=UPI00016DC62F|nr:MULTISPECIES: penicillin-binding protein 1A [unclassified Picosynechococcus]ACA98383.1 penicillin-binding protein 1B (transglycosylase, transpeptidase domains) [Picosynechococcus sp. PCC 7002]SMH46434.1 penicillin-binding protein, 1A family [Picosynechococcus sp. OG1]SMQ80656.1 penicillin-binding protein, 1A family [Synechococcus sp. 7002]
MSSSTVRQKTKKALARQSKERRSPQGFLRGVAQKAMGTVIGCTMLGSAIAAGGLVGLAISFRNLPDVRTLKTYVPTETSYIYDINGKVLLSLHGEANRTNIELSEVSPELKMAVLAIEDSHFYQHNGINPTSIGRAILSNLEAGGITEGASTITMQLVKNLFLAQDRTYNRKLAETVLALRIEQIFPKDEILEMYLNNIYWGHNNYGVETAAESYFNKSAADLTLPEAAVMAGMIQAPEDYSPFRDYQATKQRQKIVLNRLEDLGWITPEEATAAAQEPLLVGQPTAWKASASPYITQAVVEELTQRFGEELVRKGGMRVQTTVDLNMQRRAEETVQKAFQQARSRGLRADQIAVAAVDPRTHFVKVLVGGRDYEESQFNRAIQSQRQPGSAFKPFVYYSAFASGNYTPFSTIDDSPVSYPDGNGTYSPQNYGGSFSGTVSLYDALVTSKNVPAVKLGKAVGLEKVIELCRLLGIESPLQPVISLPLGAVGISPLEMASAYATFASNGWQSETTLILRVTDSQGNVLLDNTPQPRLVLDPWATASLTTVLQGVVNGGTGQAANLGDRPAAGKTGTTSSERDVWFVGYVPQLAAAVWIGNDDYRPMGTGTTGGGDAAPIWRAFMQEALKGEEPQYFPAASKYPRPKP